MLTSARRLSYIYNSAPSTNQYHVSWGAVTSWFSWLTTGVYADLDSGSYLPVDIDMDAIEMVDVTGNNDTSDSYYPSYTEETVLKTNSGYITGELARTRVQLCNKDSHGIKRVSGTSAGSANDEIIFLSSL